MGLAVTCTKGEDGA